MKILIAVDGSAQSQRAEEVLRSLVREGAHEVVVATVAPPAAVSHSDALGSLARTIRLTAGNMLAASVRTLSRSKNFRIRSRRLESSDVAGALLSAAKEERADLIVVGARGLSGTRAFLLGSVSQSVLRQAETSVLIARGDAPSRRLPRVLAAVDGSAAKDRVLAFLPRLGLPPGAPVTALHVTEDPVMMWAPEYALVGTGDQTSEMYRAALDRGRAEGRRLLDAASENLRETFSRLETVLADGFAAKEVLLQAARLRPDLVVVGRRGMGPVRRFLMGSVSQKVALHAGCSALVVH